MWLALLRGDSIWTKVSSEVAILPGRSSLRTCGSGVEQGRCLLGVFTAVLPIPYCTVPCPPFPFSCARGLHPSDSTAPYRWPFAFVGQRAAGRVLKFGFFQKRGMWIRSALSSRCLACLVGGWVAPPPLALRALPLAGSWRMAYGRWAISTRAHVQVQSTVEKRTSGGPACMYVLRMCTGRRANVRSHRSRILPSDAASLSHPSSLHPSSRPVVAASPSFAGRS